ncbi:class I SAM-dependent methyltransferase [Streptomyces sp. NPDC127068]|uniref:class I SAM-dependent methyltransferase n=1 Tax=Streptomyces sp. NPDC127068 TaxID=3347127 RepID=UPI0036519C0F
MTEPRVLELGAGYGRLGQYVLDRHPGARLTVSDVNPGVVTRLREGPLGHHPRARCEVLDATSVDAPDGAYDLAVLTMSLHHLEPAGVAALLREGTRVARTLLIVDGWRNPAYLAVVPMWCLLGGPALVHDGVISLRKLYGPAAVHALAARCGAPMRVRTRFVLPGYLVATATRESPPPEPEPGITVETHPLNGPDR